MTMASSSTPTSDLELGITSQLTSISPQHELTIAPQLWPISPQHEPGSLPQLMPTSPHEVGIPPQPPHELGIPPQGKPISPPRLHLPRPPSEQTRFNHIETIIKTLSEGHARNLDERELGLAVQEAYRQLDGAVNLKGKIRKAYTDKKGTKLRSHRYSFESDHSDSFVPKEGEEDEDLQGFDKAFMERKAVKLLRVLKGYAYPADEISFKRFAWLNLLNVLLYEDELMDLEAKMSLNPSLILSEDTTAELRRLLEKYSK